MRVPFIGLALFVGTALAASPAPREVSSVPYLSTDLLFNAGAPESAALKKLLTEAPSDPNLLRGKRIAVLTTDGVEDIELNGTLKYFRVRGARADLVAPRLPQPAPKFGVKFPAERASQILSVAYLRNFAWNRIQRFADEVHASDYDALIIPGGAWSPDSLRIDPEALRLVGEFYRAGKTTAAICHGPVVFINAGILKGHRATATWNVQRDLQNAGATVEDVPVVVDGNLVTSRHPIDMPQFVGAIERQLIQNTTR